MAELATVQPLDTPELASFYSELPKDQASEVKAAVARIRASTRDAMLETGKELIKIRDILAGTFEQWLRLEFGMSKSTGYNYINAAEAFGEAPKVIEHLPQAVVYRLAAKATPDHVRQAVVDEIASGAALSAYAVEQRIKEAKDAERHEREQSADERKWLATEKRLKKDGKTGAEIAKAKKQWSKKAATKARKEAVRIRESDAAERRGEAARLAREKATEHAVILLKASLDDDDLATFIDLLTVLRPYDLLSALQK